MFDEITPIDDAVIDPCSSPTTRREWNSDAAAAKALKTFLDKAEILDGGRHLAAREYGAVLCELPNGNVDVGPQIYVGDTILDENGVPRPGQPTVDVDPNGCPSGTRLVGMIHSHPGSGLSSLLPSINDATWIPYIKYFE